MIQKRPHIQTLLIATLLLPLGLTAHAQQDYAGPLEDRFIEAMKSEGMSDLLDYYATTYPPREKRAQYALQVINADFLAEDLRLQAMAVRDEVQALGEGEMDRANELNEKYDELMNRARKAKRKAMDVRRERLEDRSILNKDPIKEVTHLMWVSEYVLTMVDGYLWTYFSGDDAYLFSSMPEADRKEFEDAYVEVLGYMSQTMDAADRLSTRMLGDADYREKIILMGLLLEYEEQRDVILPYLLGRCLCMVGMFPIDHKYYTDPSGKVIGQVSDPEKERVRLLKRAETKLRALNSERVRDVATYYAGAALSMAESSTANVAFNDYLDPLISSPGLGRLSFRASLTKAKALAKWGRLSDAVTLLSGVANTPEIQRQLREGEAVDYLFAVDLAHDMLCDEAKKAVEAGDMEKAQTFYDRAYAEPYREILQNNFFQEELPLRPYLLTRWEQELKDIDEGKGKVWAKDLQLPGAVAALVAQVRLGRLLDESLDDAQINKFRQAADGLDHAKRVAIGQALARGEEMPPGLEAPGKEAKELRDEMLGLIKMLSPYATSADLNVRGMVLGDLGLLYYFGFQEHLYLNTELPENKLDLYAQGVLGAATIWQKVATECPAYTKAQFPMRAIYSLVWLQQLAVDSQIVTYLPQYTAMAETVFNDSEYMALEGTAALLAVYAKVLYENNDFDKVIEVAQKADLDSPYALTILRYELLVLEERAEVAFGKLEAAEADSAVSNQDKQAAKDAYNQAVELFKTKSINAQAAAEEARQKGGLHRVYAVPVELLVRLSLAQAYVWGGSPAEAIRLLEDVDKDFGPDAFKPEDFIGLDDPEGRMQTMREDLAKLVEYAEVRRLRITVDSGQVDMVIPQAKKLHAKYGERVLDIIYGINTNLRKEILRMNELLLSPTITPNSRAKMSNRVGNYGKVMLDLTQMLIEVMPEDISQLRKNQLQLMLGLAQIAAGQPVEATQTLKKLLSRSNTVQVMLAYSEAYIALGRHHKANKQLEASDKAYKNAKVVLLRLKDAIQVNRAPPYPIEFYQAYYLIFTITIETDGDIKDIPRRIDVLEKNDPPMGNPVWKDRLKRMQVRVKGLVAGQ